MTSLYLILYLSINAICPGQGQPVFFNTIPANATQVSGDITTIQTQNYGSCDCRPLLSFTFKRADALDALEKGAFVWMLKAKSWDRLPVAQLERVSKTTYTVVTTTQPVKAEDNP